MSKISLDSDYDKNNNDNNNKKFNGNINKFNIPLKKINLISLNSQQNQNDSNIRQNINNLPTEINILKYRPKRLVKINEQGYCKLPFNNIAGSTLDVENNNFRSTHSENKLKFQRNLKSQILLDNLSKNIKLMKVNDDTEFRAHYILKFAKDTNDFKKMSEHINLINDDDNRRIFNDIIYKITKNINNQTRIYLNNDYNINNNQNPSPRKINLSNENMNNHIRYNSNSNMPNIYSYKTIENSHNNLNNSISTSCPISTYRFNMKKLMIYFSDFLTLIHKFLNLIFNEILSYQKENMRLKNISDTNETKLSDKSNELEDLKKYLDKYNINTKINYEIQKIKEIKELKQEFNKKENENLLNRLRLEEQIDSLTRLLDKNKGYYDDYKNISKENDNNIKRRDSLKSKYRKELLESKAKAIIEQECREHLESDITKLNKEIDELKLEREKAKKVNIEKQAKINNLQMTLNESREKLLMLNEELEFYTRRFIEEKFYHENVCKTLEQIETKLLKMEEKKELEKNDQSQNLELKLDDEGGDEENEELSQEKNNNKNENINSDSHTRTDFT